MRYFVQGGDGSRYGPAEIDTLQKWVEENRLTPVSILIEEVSGAQVAAGALLGLRFPQSVSAAPPMAPPMASPYAQPRPPEPGPIPPGTTSNYPRGPYTPAPGAANYGTPSYSYTDDGKKDLLIAFLLCPLSLVISYAILFGGAIAAFAGIRFGITAKQKGQMLGILAIVLNVGALLFRYFLVFATRSHY